MRDQSTDAISQGEVDDSFRAVMEGLRTTLPGVQVLFAFLLTLPFQSRFSDLGSFQVALYLVALVGSAASSVLLIAPSAHQRIRAPISGVARHSPAHLATAVRIAIAGTVIFAIALAAAVYLVVEVVSRSAVAAGAVTAVVGLVLWSWFWVPLVLFSRE